MGTNESRRSTGRLTREKSASTRSSKNSSAPQDQAATAKEKTSTRPSPRSSTEAPAASPAPQKPNSREPKPISSRVKELMASNSPTAQRNTETPKVGTISKRQQIVPATGNAAISKPKPSPANPAETKTAPAGQTRRAIAPSSTAPSTTPSGVANSSKQSSIKKPLQSGTKAPSAKLPSKAPSEPEDDKATQIVKRDRRNSPSSSKRENVSKKADRASGDNMSARSQKSGGNLSARSQKTSGRPSVRHHSNKKNNIIYAALGAVLLVLVVMVIVKLTSSGAPARTIVQANDVDRGFAICIEARKLYDADRDKNARAAKAKLEEGVEILQNALDKMRLPSGDLPREYSGYDSKLANWLGFRKELREQALIEQNRIDRNGR